VTSSAHDLYISVDVETSGPNPSTYSLLSIGACVALEPDRTFYVEVQPTTDASTPEAMAVGGFDLEQLRLDGTPPREGLQRFADWIEEVTPAKSRPVFVALNAPFDWMFVADAFHRTLGHNPFGHKAIDIKALFMGATGSSWGATSFAAMARHFGVEQQQLSHNALEDAIVQAELFRRVLEVLSARDV
jgi:DNA polymerase III epsilon subunit-like protein